MVWLVILLTDVIVKVADVKATFLADVIAIFMWDDVVAHNIMYNVHDWQMLLSDL